MDKVLVVGDLHISDVYVGHHKDYWQNCIDCASKITGIIKDEGITHLILTGDLIGLREKNLRHRDSLLLVVLLLQEWNKLTNNHVYSVTGNHDVGGKLTDFGMLASMGVLKTTAHIKDISRPEDEVAYLDVGSCRFHFIDYGMERKSLNIDRRPSHSNVAITHNDIQVSGQTTWWYPSPNAFELSTMTNWKGVEFIVGGHIHNPSPEIAVTSIDGEKVSLLYAGCPTRPKKSDIWDMAYGVVFGVQEKNVDVSLAYINLPKAEQIFVDTFTDVEDETVDSACSIEELAEILDSLSQYHLDSDGDIESQIKKYSVADKEAGDIALEYYRRAVQEGA